MRLGREEKEESKRTASLCPLSSYGRRRIGTLAGIAVALAVAAMVFGGTRLGAQRPGSAPSARSQGKPVISPQSSLAPPSAAQLAPAVSVPDWPANEQPSDAIVTWDSQGLRVVAVNSSLTQILKAIATQTGATLEGANKDERVFGVYGPGPARDVISQLLDGSGYNVLLVGELRQGAPRHIILTARTAAAPEPGKVNGQSTAEDQDTGAEQEARQPEPPPGAPAGPMRSRGQGPQGLQDRQQKKLQEQLLMMQQQLNAQ